MDADNFSLSDSEFSITIPSDDDDNIMGSKRTESKEDCSNRELMAVLQSVKSDTKESRELLGVVRKDLDSHVVKTERNSMRLPKALNGRKMTSRHFSRVYGNAKSAQMFLRTTSSYKNRSR